MPASYYDDAYRTSKLYNKPVLEAPWARLWLVISRRIDKDDIVFDVGCGPGHLAELIAPKCLAYTGIDFSREAIAKATAKKIAKTTFVVADMFEYRFPEHADLYIFSEVLEHVRRDLVALRKVPRDKRVIISVPNFDNPGHERYFSSLGEAVERFDSALDITDTLDIPVTSFGRSWYLIEGVRR